MIQLFPWLRRSRLWVARVVHLIGRLVIKGLVVSGLIVMQEVPVKRLLQVVFILESCKVNALVFEAALEPFQKDGVGMLAAPPLSA